MKKAKQTSPPASVLSTPIDNTGETPDLAPRTDPVQIELIKMREVQLHLLGQSPLIFNRLSEKAKRDLLLPPPPKNKAAKQATLKHNPLQEFRDSLHLRKAKEILGPGGLLTMEEPVTRLVFPSPGFKGAAMTAALEIPGVFKSSIGRLLQVQGWQVPIWGIPEIFMTGVRQGGINKTPDIRTRAILPEWASILVVRYPVGSFDPASVANLFAAAGQICGVGDFRQEKGKGSFGLFKLVDASDPEFKRIIATGATAAQDAAIANPEAFDQETAELWSWFEETVISRGRKEEMTTHA